MDLMACKEKEESKAYRVRMALMVERSTLTLLTAIVQTALKIFQ
ncbi:Uncharacterised protein [Streptococcus equi subsp. equi]|nr:Uncharacterised protein [Streptococcus equi subsp. equi]